MSGAHAGQPGLGSTYERLRRDILLGELPSGGALVEATLADRYSVSRTPVREALRRLEQDGLIERAARSLRIRERSQEEIFQMYEVREVLEAAAARGAAERRTELDLARLDGLHQQTHDPALAVPDRTPLNNELHLAIWRASHNAVLFETIERLFSSSLRYLNTTLGDDARWTSSIDEHAAVVEAIRHCDATAAHAQMARHIRSARATRLDLPA